MFPQQKFSVGRVPSPSIVNSIPVSKWEWKWKTGWNNRLCIHNYCICDGCVLHRSVVGVSHIDL